MPDRLILAVGFCLASFCSLIEHEILGIIDKSEFLERVCSCWFLCSYESDTRKRTPVKLILSKKYGESE